MSSVFGRIFVAAQLEQAAIDTLQEWFPTHLREIERQLGRTVGQIPVPTNYTNRNRFDSQPGEEIPKCVVISPGVSAVPRKSGSGQYAATWGLGIGVATADKDEAVANLLVKIYAAAVRDIILKHSSLGGVATNIEWRDENYDDLPVNDKLQLYKASANYFEVEVQNVVTRYGGPEIPDLPSYPDYGEVEKVIIELDKEVL